MTTRNPKRSPTARPTRVKAASSIEDVRADMVSNAELDELDWTNSETKQLPKETEVLEPFGWKILVMPMRRAPVSKGGIIIPETRMETDAYLNYVGRIVALGPLVYKHSKYAGMGMAVKDQYRRGDWVLYPIYHYARVDFRGTKLILLNDDSFLARVPKGVSPWDFKLDR